MLASVLLAAPLVAAASYPLVDSHKGKTFLDGWTVPASTYDNTTSGDVFWAAIDNSTLMYPTDDGRFILKVDNTSFVPYNDKRYAPKLESKTAYKPGSVFVMDAVHMPYGCSVWGAFWTQGADWPAGGEIDIMEGVNMQTTNQIALHTAKDGCYASNDTTMTGELRISNCSVSADGGSGCTVGNKEDNSYGEAFAKAGGGVYVCEYTEDFIKIWFKSRPDVPKEMTADAQSLDTSILGEPTAWYDKSTCEFSKFFSDQILTIDITLCGTWAGVQSVLEATCPKLEGDKTCYTTYVINEPSSQYANAYFDLNYINVYSTSTSGSNSSSASGSSTDGAKKSDASGSGGRTKLNTPASKLTWAGAIAGVVAGAFVLVI